MQTAPQLLLLTEDKYIAKWANKFDSMTAKPIDQSFVSKARHGTGGRVQRGRWCTQQNTSSPGGSAAAEI
jgi:hypothetical protein